MYATLFWPKKKKYEENVWGQDDGILTLHQNLSFSLRRFWVCRYSGSKEEWIVDMWIILADLTVNVLLTWSFEAASPALFETCLSHLQWAPILDDHLWNLTDKLKSWSYQGFDKLGKCYLQPKTKKCLELSYFNLMYLMNHY